jgi:hypothetical protein
MEAKLGHDPPSPAQNAEASELKWAEKQNYSSFLCVGPRSPAQNAEASELKWGRKQKNEIPAFFLLARPSFSAQLR